MTSVVVKVLTLETCLVLLAGVGQLNACTKEQRPSIEVTTNREIITWVEEEGLLAPLYHGENVTLHCTGENGMSLSIQTDGKNLTTTPLNTTTIQLFVNNPNVGCHAYNCTDSRTGCRDSVTVIVDAVISVWSPRASHRFTDEMESEYFVPFGDDYHIFCSGDDVQKLSLEAKTISSEWKLLDVIIVNTTAIKHVARADVANNKIYYKCGRSPFTISTVLVDYYPTAHNFQCIVYEWRKLECSWSSSTKLNTFRLIYKYSGGTELICHENYGVTTVRGCTSNMLLYDGNDSFLILETCNGFICNDQTIPYDPSSILKLDPLPDLRLLNTSSRGAILTWKRFASPYSILFKVEYRLLATEWIQVNTSSVRCRNIHCVLELNLPCPDSHYEVRVYIRIEEAAGERFWSEPVNIFFFTKPQYIGVVGPQCNAEYTENEPMPSIEMVLYKIRQLLRYERKEKNMLKKKISDLKRKVAKIKELAKLIGG